MSGDKDRTAQFYLRAEIVEADHARQGLPSGDVLRAKSSTAASILLRVGSSALASPATRICANGAPLAARTRGEPFSSEL